jgi:uncharacterized protein (TIGR02118 family)
VFKVTVLLTKRADLTHEEFVNYWESTHADLVEAMPGVRRYTMGVPGRPEDSAYDGVAELYFEDFAAMREAYATPEGEELQADAHEFADMEASDTLFVDETVAFEAE